ncbi:MAG: hypothetical protein JXB36_04385 [Gammaproteobacteria bacterium]|nr:hypothetical protein [Gammaproteobacteria bacterium]
MLRPVLLSAMVAAAFVPWTEAAAQTPETCDRACLENWVDQYLVAMRDANVDPDLFARDLKFTENGIRLPLGNEGLWHAMSGIGSYKFYVPDTQTRQVAFIGTVRENGTGPDDGDVVALALRLKIRDERITEIEQLAIRPSSVNSSRGDFPPTGEGVEAMGSPHPIFGESIPEDQRMSREELITTANYYFTGLENNDGQGYYPFTEDCVRFENGVDVLARGGTRITCKEQFETGVRGIVSRIRDRRFVAVDREKGIVFSFAFFDHHRINWTWQLAELFKIENGQIRRIEAVFHRAPFGINSGWSTYEQGISNVIQDVR